jgi:hypothetical protein
MENSPVFNLNHALHRWRDGLSQSPHFREENLAELEAHLRDSVAEWQSRGLTDEEAFLLAARRLGNPVRLDTEFAKVNRGQVWLNRALWMLVGVQVWGLLGFIARVATDAAVFGGLTGLGYKFQGAGQFSTANLFAAALFGLANLVALAACIAACWWLVRRKEAAAHKVAVKALRRPVLLGLVVTVVFVVIAVPLPAELPLLLKYYPAEVIGSVRFTQSLANWILSPLETLAFMILTIVLFRRRLRLGSAS